MQEDTSSERRLAENEVVFRQMNEQVHSGYEETNRMAREDNQPQFLVEHKSDDMPLLFYCECADENCRERIRINIHDYNKIHVKRDQFILIPGHETHQIERIVSKKAGYYIVQKRNMPPEKADTLHPTSLNNV
jgi:hypothetical protein